MNRPTRFWCCLAGASLGACSFIPPVPDDTTLPIQEILHHAACELQYAFHELAKPDYASFNASKWLVALKLTPKFDSDVAAGAGYTGKSTSISGARYFNNWALGSLGAPGANVEAKGTRNAAVTFKMSSKDLLNPKNRHLCPLQSPRAHSLTQHLGIGEWLVRLVQARDMTASFVKLDTPTYSSEIFVKFSGNGNFTYSFPFGTNFGALSGYYDLDETLEITLSPAPDDKISVQTLPRGGVFTDGPTRVPVGSAVSAEQKLDDAANQQSLLNAIKNIPRQ